MNTHDTFRAANGSAVVGASQLVADCEDRLHAVRSGLAGVAGALHVLAEDRSGLSDDTRHRLQAMLMTEVARLQRLVEPERQSQPAADLEVLDMDRVISDVVLARRLAGQEVAWTPAGHTAWGRHDDLVEVLNILLVNAWRHAGGSPARIQVAETAGTITISVSDDGPGVPAHLSESIFERGVRRTASPGQGLGLAMARELVARFGATLSLVPRGAVGACFCITLAAAGRSVAA